MAGIPFWDAFHEGYEGELVPSNQPWLVCVLGDFPLPGKADVNGSAQKRIDVQKSNGKDGGVLIERGYAPGEIDIDLEMWTPAQWERFQHILAIIFRPSGKLDLNDAAKKKKGASATAIETTRMAAVPIRHPKAALLKIAAVLIKQVTLPRLTPDGSQVVTIKCVQYLEPPPTSASAIRRASGVQAPPIDPPQVFDNPANKPAKPSDAGDGGVDGAPASNHGA